MNVIVTYLKKKISIIYAIVWLKFPILFFGILSASLTLSSDRIVFLEFGKLRITDIQFCFVLFVLFLLVWLYCKHFIDMEINGETDRIPYCVHTGIHDCDTVFTRIEQKHKLIEFDKGFFYGCFQNVGNVDWRIFVFVPEALEYDDSLRIADEYAQRINEMTGFKPDPHFFKGDGGFAVRGQILIYEKVPEKILRSAQRRVEQDILQKEPFVNFLVDLSKGMIFVPKLNFRYEVMSEYEPYLYAIERVGEYLELR